MEAEFQLMCPGEVSLFYFIVAEQNGNLGRLKYRKGCTGSRDTEKDRIDERYINASNLRKELYKNDN